MRDYSKITPRFWIGKTGRAMRGDPDLFVVAFYLCTGPHANMIGLYYLPIAYISGDTGIPCEGVAKALDKLTALGFCSYDQDAELIWVISMLKIQVAERLKAGDNNSIAVAKIYETLPESRILSIFYDKYSETHNLPYRRGLDSSLPRAFIRQEQEQEQEQNQETEQKQDFFVPAQPKRKKKQSITETAEPQIITSAARAWSILVKRMTDQPLPENEEAIVSTPEFQEAVKMVGGGKYLSKLEPKYLPSVKKDFIAAYNQVRTRCQN